MKTNQDLLPLVGFSENQGHYNCQLLQSCVVHLLNSQDLEQCLAYNVCSRNSCGKNGYLKKQKISKRSIFSFSFEINYITSFFPGWFAHLLAFSSKHYTKIIPLSLSPRWNKGDVFFLGRKAMGVWNPQYELHKGRIFTCFVCCFIPNNMI